MVVLAVLAMVSLYLARTPVHRAIRSATRALRNGMRLTARSLDLIERRLVARNREVLLSAGREAAERVVEREFERIEAAVNRDLSDYPALHRRLSTAIQRIEEDYQSHTESPPAPEDWVHAVEAIAKIPSSRDTMARVLKDIQTSIERDQAAALAEYRKATGMRHRVLSRAMPHWRHLVKGIDSVSVALNRLLERSRSIDRYMEEYRSIVRGDERAERALSSSSLTQFFIAGLVLAIAVGGALVNFHLIARPLQEMVGGSAYIAGFKVSQVAALVIILTEIAMGLFFMEAMRVTRLFPVISALDDRLRIRMGWASFVLLFILAGVEAGLAYMREVLAQDDAALVAQLAGTESAAMSQQWITSAAQMGMGFILPFALTFVAIPLESFIHSARTVFGVLAVLGARALAFSFRLGGNIFHHLGMLLIQLYDIVAFAPLGVEKLIAARSERAKPARHGKVAEA
ncbi:MAG: hypothetical protein AB7U81_09175 [Thiohalomonadaceae bacterium]